MEQKYSRVNYVIIEEQNKVKISPQNWSIQFFKKCGRGLDYLSVARMRNLQA